MVKILIVGDRHSGKATFLGLLYATQVRSGSDLADTFRFHAPYESLNALSYAFQQLMSGAFPDPRTKEGLRSINLQLSYGSSETGGLLNRRRSRKAPDSPNLQLVMFGTTEDSFSNVLAGSRTEDEMWTDVYDPEALLILVDCTKLAVMGEGKDEHKKGAPMSAFDRALALLLPLVRRPSEPEERKRIHPIFLFSKFDRISPDVLNRLNIASQPPPVAETRLRNAYAETLLTHNLPRTMGELRIRGRDSVKLADPVSYFLWVRTTTVPGKPDKIEFARGEDGGWHPIYARHEYVALLDHLGKILLARR